MIRIKEESTEAKKAEDKARRDQIFQSYQQRKAEREAEEEMSKAGMAPVKRRLKAKAPRPKSQPPGSMGAPHVQVRKFRGQETGENVNIQVFIEIKEIHHLLCQCPYVCFTFFMYMYMYKLIQMCVAKSGY